MGKTIGNPLSWAVSAVGSTVGYASSVGESIGTHGATEATSGSADFDW